MSSEFNINDLQLKYLELETLLDITNELNSFDQISVLLQEILVKSCAVLNASSGLILIEDDNSDVLHIGADFNIDIFVLKVWNQPQISLEHIQVYNLEDNRLDHAGDAWDGH